MRCLKCKYKLSGLDLYCPHCGEELSQTVREETILEEKRKDLIKKAYIVVVTLTLMILVTYMFFYSRDSHGRGNCANAVCPETCSGGICECTFINNKGEPEKTKCNVPESHTVTNNNTNNNSNNNNTTNETNTEKEQETPKESKEELCKRATCTTNCSDNQCRCYYTNDKGTESIVYCDKE